MKLTAKTYVQYLFTFFNERTFHNDFQELNSKKLEILNKYLGLEDKVKLIEDGTFHFSLINDSYLNTSAFPKHFSKDLSPAYKNILHRLIVNLINSEFSKLKSCLKIRSGLILESNEIIEELYNSINSRQKDYAINSHMEQIKKIHLETIVELLRILYAKDYSVIPDSFEDFNKQCSWKINVEITDEEDLKVLRTNLDFHSYL